VDVYVYIKEAINDIGILVQQQMDRHAESGEKCPLINVKDIFSGMSLVLYDNHRLKHYASLDERAQSILQDCAKDLQINKEISLANIGFDKEKLEKEYENARRRPYLLAGTLAFFGTAIPSALVLANVLPYDQHVNTTATALLMGTIVGGAGWVAEQWWEPIIKVVKPLEKIMMLDFEMKDMRGTYICDEKIMKHYVKKLYQYIKRTYIDIEMRA